MQNSYRIQIGPPRFSKPTSNAMNGRPITSISPHEEQFDWRRLILALAGCVLCLLILPVTIGPAFALDEDQSTKNPYYFFYQHFINPNSRLTDLQQEQAWSKYEGRWIRWTGIIGDVRTVFDAPIVTIDMALGSILPDVSFKLASMEVAQSLKKNSRIFFTGRLNRRPGKIFSLGLQDAEIIPNPALADFYPLYYVSRRPAYIFGTPEDYGEIAERLANKRSIDRLISRAEREGRFAEVQANRLIILRGNISGNLSEAEIVGIPGTCWIMNSSLRKEGIPVKDILKVVGQ